MDKGKEENKRGYVEGEWKNNNGEIERRKSSKGGEGKKEIGQECYAHVIRSPLLVRGCVTNRKNVCPNSNAHEKYAHSEASVAATQDTGRVHVQ